MNARLLAQHFLGRNISWLPYVSMKFLQRYAVRYLQIAGLVVFQIDPFHGLFRSSYLI
jgi:hypothetical protein